MKRNNLTEKHRKKADKPQFIMFGKEINGVIATAATVILLLVTAIILVVVLAMVMQTE